MSEATVLTQAPFKLKHLSPVIGTEVHDINLADVSDQDVAWLMDLLVERKVLFFRDQDISVDEHIAFAARFGELEVHPFTDNLADQPEVIRLHNDADNPPYINVWHSDVTWREVPSLGSVLRARVVPEVGGDTLFANMESAYDALDDATKQRIADMTAVHDNEGFLQNMLRKGATEQAVEAMRQKFPPSRHPVVRTHPVSGRKSLYVNKTFTRYIDGLAADESDALLQKLFLQAWIPDFQCRFQWRPNSFAFWDNRGAQHYANADYYPEVRTMERVTIVGDKPF